MQAAQPHGASPQKGDRVAGEFRNRLDRARKLSKGAPMDECENAGRSRPGAEFAGFAKRACLLLLAYYDSAPPPIKTTRKARKAWRRTSSELEVLRTAPGSPAEEALRARLLHPSHGLESPKATDETYWVPPSAGARGSSTGVPRW